MFTFATPRLLDLLDVSIAKSMMWWAYGSSRRSRSLESWLLQSLFLPEVFTLIAGGGTPSLAGWIFLVGWSNVGPLLRCLEGAARLSWFLQCEGLCRIQRRGRWSQLRTVEHYIQEVAAQTLLHSLSPLAKAQVKLMSSAAPILLDLFLHSVDGVKALWRGNWDCNLCGLNEKPSRHFGLLEEFWPSCLRDWWISSVAWESLCLREKQSDIYIYSMWYAVCTVMMSCMSRCINDTPWHSGSTRGYNNVEKSWWAFVSVVFVSG